MQPMCREVDLLHLLWRTFRSMACAKLTWSYEGTCQPGLNPRNPVVILAYLYQKPFTFGEVSTNFIRSARGVPQAVANLELVTAPDQALFGSRIETSCGPYAAKVG